MSTQDFRPDQPVVTADGVIMYFEGYKPDFEHADIRDQYGQTYTVRVDSLTALEGYNLL